MPEVNNLALRRPKRVQCRGGGEIRTHQAFKDECDIGQKVRRWSRQGILADALKQPPLPYGDFSNVDDYMTALIQVRATERAFMSLPANMRNALDNDPQVMLDKMADPEWQKRFAEMGVENVEAPAPPEKASETPPEPPSEAA